MSGVVALDPGAAAELARALSVAAVELEDVADRARRRLVGAAVASGAPALIEDVAAWARRLGGELRNRLEAVVRLDAALPPARPHLGTRVRYVDVRGEEDLDDLLTALVSVGVLGACPAPDDPRARRAALAALGPAAVRRLAEQAPVAFGPADGVPFADRNRANRRILAAEIARLESGAVLPGSPAARLLADLRGWRDDPELRVVKLDVAGGRVVLARGDLDTATHVATIVPGAGTSLATLSERHTTWLDGLHQDMRRRVRGGAGGAATVLWLDYDAPQRLVPDAARSTAATDAAERLQGYLDGVASGSSPQHTLIGHSYGSVVLGRALVDNPGRLRADQLVALGSPGLGVQHGGQLALREDQRMFAGTFAEDPIVHAGRWHPATGVLPRAIHGPDPRRLRGVETIELSTHDLRDAGPVERHLQYFEARSSALGVLAGLATGAGRQGLAASAGRQGPARGAGREQRPTDRGRARGPG